MIAVIHPGRSEGAPVSIPGSKSMSHRALIAAALSAQDTVITGLVENRDTEATMRCLSHLGASFEPQDDGHLLVHGIGKAFSYDGAVIDCGESGSTLRFLIPLFSLTEEAVTFTGHGKLMSRPQTVYEELFEKQGLQFEAAEDTLSIKGALKPDDYVVRGDISSQFISGLLFALPLRNRDSSITVLPPYESKSYVGLTMDVLEKAGIRFEETDATIHIPGNQTYQASALHVEGDDSQAAFFAVLALTSQKPVAVQNMAHESRQGDHVIVSLIERAGGQSIPMEGGYTFLPGKVKAFTADLADCPDLGPVLFALAAVAEGTSVFTHCGRLRIKESDRIAAMKEELGKLGVLVQEDGDTVTIEGVPNIKGGVALDGHNDHRIVMALSVLAVRAEQPITISGAEAITKSYPNFFEDLRIAGAEVTYGSQ